MGEDEDLGGVEIDGLGEKGGGEAEAIGALQAALLEDGLDAEYK